MSQRFPKAMRLRKRREFLAVQSRGRRLHGRYFLVIVTPGVGRVGITVSKKVGNAVQRNRLKRLVREFVRLNDWLPTSVDAVVIAKRAAAAAADLATVTADLERLQGRLVPR